MRIDKWLWAARFFKTRPQAMAAVNGGKVKLNGQVVKPARQLSVGDELTITRGAVSMTITILGLHQQRRPAKEAQLLYQETESSRQQREQARQLRRLQRAGMPQTSGKPTRQQRRALRRLRHKDF